MANDKRKKNYRDKKKNTAEKEFEGKGNSKYSKEDSRGKTAGRNDPKWYATESQLMKDAARLSFESSVGNPVNLNGRQNLGTADSYTPIPSILELIVQHTPGQALSWEDPINVAARKLYTFVRHENSGHTNYDAGSLMFYILMMDNAFAFYAWMVRLYGTMNLVVPHNRATPEGLVLAQGGNYTSLMQNLANFRGYINSYASRLNAMAVPTLPIFQRHMWLYSNIYADSPSNKCQFYVMRPQGFWLDNSFDNVSLKDYEGNAIMHPAWLKHLPRSAAVDDRMDYHSIMDLGETLLRPLLNVEDYNIMSGDILKAYKGEVFKLPLIDAEYKVTPVYDPEVLLQIHNATILSTDTYTFTGQEATYGAAFGIENIWDGGWGICQCTRDEDHLAGCLLFTPNVYANTSLDDNRIGIGVSNAQVTMDKILDMPIDNPDHSLVAVATRLMAGYKYTFSRLDSQAPKGVSDARYMLNIGTEVVVQAYAWYKQEHDGLTSQIWKIIAPYEYDKSKDQMKMMAFEQRPIYYDIDCPTWGQVSLASVAAVGGDLNNYAIVDNETLSNIHRAATLALYGII